MKTIDSLLMNENEAVDLLKLHVQGWPKIAARSRDSSRHHFWPGYELQVLEGARRSLSTVPWLTGLFIFLTAYSIFRGQFCEITADPKGKICLVFLLTSTLRMTRGENLDKDLSRSEECKLQRGVSSGPEEWQITVSGCNDCCGGILDPDVQ